MAFQQQESVLVTGPYYTVLEKAEREFQRNAQKIADVLTRVDRPDVVLELNDYRSFAENRLIHERRAAANQALVALVTLFRDTVKNLANQLESDFPRASGRYPGKHEFSRIQAEFHQRFGIDLKAAPSLFEFIVPLSHARDLVIHNEGRASAEFKEQWPWLVDHVGRIYLSLEQVTSASRAAGVAVQWLAAALCKVRIEHRGLLKLRSAK